MDRAGGVTLNILTVATEWSSAHGGLSTFNRSLCSQLAKSGHSVKCAMERIDGAEIQEAERHGVQLLTFVPRKEDVRSAKASLNPGSDSAWRPHAIIGHGRITGKHAVHIRDDVFPGVDYLHFIHMAPDEIEWFKSGRSDDAGARAEIRTNQELDLGVEASCVFAVGPKLYHRYLKEFHGRKYADVNQFDPGFDHFGESEFAPAPEGKHWQILMMGRAEDYELKGLKLAAEAVGDLVRSRSDNSPEIELVVRGAEAEKSQELRSRIIGDAKLPGLTVTVRAFSADSQRIREDIRKSSLVLMPSLIEGFGLVGQEAIADGVPVLVSSRSGLGYLLREHLTDEEFREFVVRISHDPDIDRKVWSAAIDRVLSNRSAAFERTAAVAAKLRAKVPWRSSLEKLETSIRAVDLGQGARARSRGMDRASSVPRAEAYCARLIGREHDARELLGRLLDDNGPRALLIHAMGGMGKTALAHAIARRCITEERFDAYAWVSTQVVAFSEETARPIPVASTASGRDTYDIRFFVERIATAVGCAMEPTASLHQNLLALRAFFDKFQSLVVLDNMEAVEPELRAEVLDAILPALGDGRMIITSREALSHPAVQEYELGGIWSHGIEYMRTRISAVREADEIEVDDGQLHYLVQKVGALPLFMNLVVGQLVFRSAGEVVREIASFEADSDNAFSGIYRYLYERALSVLTAEEQGVFLTFKFFEPMFGAEFDIITRLHNEISGAEVERHLRRLCNISLVLRVKGFRSIQYALHPLTYNILQSDLLDLESGANDGSA